MESEVLKSFSATQYDCFEYFFIIFNALIAMARTSAIFLSSFAFWYLLPKKAPTQPPVTAAKIGMRK